MDSELSIIKEERQEWRKMKKNICRIYADESGT